MVDWGVLLPFLYALKHNHCGDNVSCFWLVLRYNFKTM